MSVNFRILLRHHTPIGAFVLALLCLALSSSLSVAQLFNTAQTFDPLGRGLLNQNRGVISPQGGTINNLGIGPLRGGSYQGPQLQPRIQTPVRPNDNFPFGVRQPQTLNPLRGQFNTPRLQTGPAFQQPQTPPPCGGCAQPGCRHCQSSKRRHFIPKLDGRKTPGQQGQLLMTPSRIIAPVGSEVVVLAGICGGDGYFATNQPLEWMLSNDSVGQIIEVGGMHHPTFNKVVPPQANKFDGQYAHGRTGLKEIVLTRGTPTPCDDIQLRKGQTFVSISSASPGTTYLTGVAPRAESWDRRRATTRIYWVDGTWAVPAPIRATAGTVSPLTTVISQADGNGGIDGWKVRYTIVGGAPAEFAPAGSQTAEATSSSSGEATVQIRQRAGQFDPGTTQVRVDIVRPAVLGERELLVESGITSVTWSAPALTIRAIGDATAGIDKPFNYRIEVTNPGDQLARDVVVRTKDFDPDIEYISATPKPTQYGSQYEWEIGDLPPGSPPQIIDVQLRTKKRGTIGLCFEVASDSDRLRTEACAQTEVSAPCIGLEIEGPDTARVGEELVYEIGLVNQCEEPLRNIRLRITPDAALVADGTSSRVIEATIPELGFGQRRDLPLGLLATAPGRHCFRLEVTTENGDASEALECVVVRQQGQPAVDLQLQGGAPVRVGERVTVNAIVTNTGNTALNAVSLINEYPRSLSPKRISENAEPVLDPNEDPSSPLVMKLGRLEPGDEAFVVLQYEGLQVDPDAQLSFSVTSSESASNTRGLPIRVEPSASGDNRGRDPNRPEFTDPSRPRTDSDGNPVFPSTPTVPRDRPANPTGPEPRIEIPQEERSSPSRGLGIRMQLGSEAISISGQQQAAVRFVITNNDTVPHEDVDISLSMPPGLRFLGTDFGDTRLGIANAVTEQSSRIDYTRRQVLRPGDEIALIIGVAGQQPGRHTIGVQVESLQSRAVTDNISISVNP